MQPMKRDLEDRSAESASKKALVDTTVISARLAALKTKIAKSHTLPATAALTSRETALEWWDVPLVSGPFYESCCVSSQHVQAGVYADATRLSTFTFRDSAISEHVFHPVPFAHPFSKSLPDHSGNPVVMQVMLTKEEKRKLKREKARARQEHEREMILAGLMDPPMPRLTMKNVLRVLGSEHAKDPTAVEKLVRDQIAARLRKHEEENEARKLDAEGRRTKRWARMQRDAERGTEFRVYKIANLQHPKLRFKIATNAKQMYISGSAVLVRGEPGGVLLCEGGPRMLGKFGRLLSNRIQWEDMDSKCSLVWSGLVAQRLFHDFLIHEFESQHAAEQYLSAHDAAAFYSIALKSPQQ
eukprot:ANDGO_08094.mRNA.1 U4/U5/U6 small nuclear ribonucleoprotein prp3